jgi:uncharacterized protein (DUF697 family)
MKNTPRRKRKEKAMSVSIEKSRPEEERLAAQLEELRASGLLTEEEFRAKLAALKGQEAPRPNPSPGPNPGPPAGDRAKSARTLVVAATAVAAFVGLIPLPVADAPFIVITQIVMLYLLTRKFGRPMGFSLFWVVVSVVLGPLLFSSLAKLIPFLGSLIGAAVAGGLTYIVGKSTLLLLEEGREFNFDSYKKAFPEVFKK